MEDTEHLALGFAREAGVVPVIATLNMDFIRYDTTRSCTVIGAAGSLRWNAWAGTVEIFGQGGNAWQIVFAHNYQMDDTYLAEWRHCLVCISDGGSPALSGSDGLAVLRIIEAASHSSTNGVVVPVKQEESGRGKPRAIV